MLWFTKPLTGDISIMENLNKNHFTIDHRKISAHKILISRKETLVKVTKNFYLKFDTLVGQACEYFRHKANHLFHGIQNLGFVHGITLKTPKLGPQFTRFT
jgi:hypothetical protein